MDERHTVEDALAGNESLDNLFHALGESIDAGADRAVGSAKSSRHLLHLVRQHLKAVHEVVNEQGRDLVATIATLRKALAREHEWRAPRITRNASHAVDCPTCQLLGRVPREGT